MTVKLLVASYLSRWLAPSTSDTDSVTKAGRIRRTSTQSKVNTSLATIMIANCAFTASCWSGSNSQLLGCCPEAARRSKACMTERLSHPLYRHATVYTCWIRGRPSTRRLLQSPSMHADMATHGADALHERESRWLNEACPGADRRSAALTCGMLGTRVSSLSL